MTPLNGNLKWIVTTIVACVLAVASATAFIVNHVGDTGIHQTPAQKELATEDTIQESLKPMEVDIRYIRRDIQEIKAAILELQQ